MITLRTLIEWAMTGKYDLDKPLKVQVEQTDYVKEYLPKEEVLYMPVVSLNQYDWAVVLGMGAKE